MKKIKNKIEPRLLDIEYLNRELLNLFASVRHGEADELFGKYKSRFVKEQKEKNNPNPVQSKDSNSILSVGKKLEILCTYGNHVIVKIDRKQQH